MGIFAELQPIYAEHDIPTFPVVFEPDGRKKPATSRYDKVGIRGSAAIAGRPRFSAHDTFGFKLGRRSRVTILDVDTPDEKVLADALDRHGPSPLIVRTGSGKYHAYYRHQGEPRAIRPWRDLPIDLLGGGVAVAAPSRAPRGFYQIIQGSLADLDRLPRIKAVDDLTRHNDNTSPKAASPESIAYGQRNAALFNFCLAEARDCGSSDELLERATAFAHTVLSPVPKPVSAGEIRDTAMSAWRIEQRGDNMVGAGRCVVLKHDFMDRYLDASGPGHDALILVATLKRHHWGRDRFALAKTMAPKLGWRPARFYKARQRLIDDSVIRCIHPGGRGPSDPALYAWVNRNRKPRPAGDGI